MNGQIVGRKWNSLQFPLPTLPFVYPSFDCVMPTRLTTLREKVRVQSSSAAVRRKKAANMCDSMCLRVDPLCAADARRCQRAYRSPRHVTVIRGTFVHFTSLHLSLSSQQTVRKNPRVRP